MAKGYLPPRHRSSDPRHFSSERNNTTESIMNFRPGTFSLPLNAQMAIPFYTVPSRQDVEFGGRMLFHNFIHEQFSDEGLSEELLAEIENQSPNASGDVGQFFFSHQAGGAPSLAESTPEGYTPNNLIQIGGNLRDLANQFARSRERPLIRDEADKVDLNSINQEDFFNMLSIIFKDGIDRHCLIALFFFCSDVLIRCVKENLRHIGTRCFLWAMQFLVEKVCAWVLAHGGWERVLSRFYSAVFEVSKLVALGILITCGFVWIRKNWVCQPSYYYVLEN